MKTIEELAAEYWLEVTEAVYNDRMSIASHIMEAFIAGAEAQKKLNLDD